MRILQRVVQLCTALALLQGCNGDGKDDGTQLCLDRPDRLSSAPKGQLPCELIAPGLTLKK